MYKIIKIIAATIATLCFKNFRHMSCPSDRTVYSSRSINFLLLYLTTLLTIFFTKYFNLTFLALQTVKDSHARTESVEQARSCPQELIIHLWLSNLFYKNNFLNHLNSNLTRGSVRARAISAIKLPTTSITDITNNIVPAKYMSCAINES